MEFSVLLLLLVSPVIRGQDCPEFRNEELGDSIALSTDGLLAATVAAVSGEAARPVQITSSNIVCLGQGTRENTYRTVSVVVEYLSGGTTTTTTSQVEFQCIEANGETRWGFAAQPSISTPAAADLTTPNRTDCILCIKPEIVEGTVTVTPMEHCAACAPCMRLNRCTGSLSSQTCCNDFDMSGVCVESCPENSTSSATFECECNPGYAPSGSSCVEIDECDPNPCGNGGSCTDMIDAFTCTCAAGYTGPNCTIDIDECDPNPCENGGSCNDLINAFTCTCAPGFTGPNCTIDECNPNPCENEGTCALGSCSCAPGFTGTMCEIAIECDIKNCLRCSSKTMCAECESGYRLTKNKCQASNNTLIIVIVVILVVAIFLAILVTSCIIIVVKKKRDDKAKNKIVDHEMNEERDEEKNKDE